jgi:hypothetical protein
MLNGLRSDSIPLWLRISSAASAAARSSDYLVSFVDDGVQTAGIPVITSTLVVGGTLAWGIDKSQQRYVLR